MVEASLITTTLIRNKKEDRIDKHGNGDDEHPNLKCCLLESTSGFSDEQEKAGKLLSPDVMEKKEISPLKQE
ncbi:hypothetical protein Tco_0395685, partial [Tanacetum coccineum]